MNAEERKQVEIEKIYDTILPVGISYEEGYSNLEKYRGKYKNEVAGMFAYELQQSYCAGYYKYEKKQSSIHDIRKELYIKICDEYLTLDGCLEAPIYSFFKGDNKKVLKQVDEFLEKNHDKSGKTVPSESDFCVLFLDYYKNAFDGFWKGFAEIAKKYNYKECAELAALMDEFYSCEDNQSGIEILLNYTQSHHECIMPYEILGFLYSEEKMWYNAIQCFEKIIDKGCLFYPHDLEFALAWTYGKVKEYKNEEIAYRNCLECKSDIGNALNNLGYCLYHQKRYQEAIEIFLRCVKEERDLAWAPNNLVRTYIRSGQYSTAREFVETHDYKISKALLEQLDKKPKKDVPVDSVTIGDDEDGMEDEDSIPVSVEVDEIKPKFFENKNQFTSEKVLEDELTARLENGQELFGLNLHIYRKKGDYYGRQYPCANGKWRLDILCEDDDENLYIIELKKDSGYDDAFEQTKQYVDWFEKHKVKKGRKVYGIIVLNSPKNKIIEKVRSDNRIRLFEYQIAYREIK